MLLVGGCVLLCFVGAALIGSAVLIGEGWKVLLLGIGIAVLFVALFGSPILLGACAKVAQDKAVRDDKTDVVNGGSS